MRRRWRRGSLRGDRADRGSIAPMVAVLGVTFLLLIGLVVDSSRVLTARGRAVSYAEEAARAGAQAINPASDPIALEPDQAQQRVDAYCAQVEASEPTVAECRFVGIDGVNVTVHVKIDEPTTLLGIVGVTDLPASGDGSAKPVVG